METKRCSKCHVEQPLSEFWKMTKNKDGLHHQCKNCFRKYNQTQKRKENLRRYEQTEKWRIQHRRGAKKREEYFREYRTRPGIRQRKALQSRQQRARHPLWAKARSAVNHAVRDGILPSIHTQVCVDCGNQATQYHHTNYAPEQWLDVLALCLPCHKKRHGQTIWCI